MATAYLVAYNAVQTVGWGYVLALTGAHFAEGGSPQTLYNAIEAPLQLFQTLAILEVIHAAVGLVRSPVMTTLMQVYSRVFLVWAIMWAVPSSRSSLFVTTMVVAWCITEIVRYSFYALALLNSPLYIVTWLRYTLFFILYPLGAGSEVGVIIAALPEVGSKHLYSSFMPNKYNFSFDFYYFLIVSILLYIPGFPQMYTYMIGQRKKVIGGEGATADKKKK